MSSGRKAGAVVLVMLIGTLLACGSSDSSSKSSTTVTLEVDDEGLGYQFEASSNGELTGRIGDVRFDISGVPIGVDQAGVKTTKVKGLKGTGTPGLFVGNATLRLADGHLFLGDTDYGSVASEDVVTIRASGVSVNGEMRGALPAG